MPWGFFAREERTKNQTRRGPKVPHARGEEGLLGPVAYSYKI